MLKWEDLSWYQKTAFWCFIGIVGWFAPEIALLFHFGGIEVVFAFLAVYTLPLTSRLQHYFRKFSASLAIAVLAFQHSASARPQVYFAQAAFCCMAFALTGSALFCTAFLMPGILFNGLLV